MHLLYVTQNVIQSLPLDTITIATVISFFVPLLVSFITKQSASDGMRAVVNIIAVAITSVLALWINPSGVLITVALVLNTFVMSLVASFTAYKGVWKPTGIAGTITAATANIGLGSPPLMETADKGAEDMGQADADPHENS